MMQNGPARWRLALLKGVFYVGARLSAARIPQPRFVIRIKRWLKFLLIGILGNGQPLLVTVRGRQMYLRPDLFREYVADEYEPFTVEIFERSVRQGATVIDVGAGVGYFTLIAGERVGEKGKVYAFEPVPETFELLARNVQVNGLENVTPVRKAVGESDGQATLFVAELPEQSGLYQVPSDRLSRVTVPSGWDVLRWDGAGGALVLRKGDAFALLPRWGDRNWGAFTELGAPAGLSAQWEVATNGRLVIGVKEGLTTPPELVAFDLTTRKTATLTQLNPQLHRRRYGAVQEFAWSHAYESKARGYLIEPVDYRPSVRYPLVVLLDDHVLGRVEDPYLLDGTRQLQGHAIQMLAAQGFMVLYPRTPGSLRGVLETPEEGRQMCAQIEAAIAALDRAGLIDPSRVGVSGWSRAAYHTDYLLIHSSHRFAAATQIDGGGVEYADGLRPFTDEELKRIRTPLLFQAHRLPTLVLHATMADRLESFGKPTEILYFATASHSTTRPQHRLRSLGTHIDWWRFWLKGEEDASPAKAAQYARWRMLREMQNAPK